MDSKEWEEEVTTPEGTVTFEPATDTLLSCIYVHNV
jgi:hypothetical protein